VVRFRIGTEQGGKNGSLPAPIFLLQELAECGSLFVIVGERRRQKLDEARSSERRRLCLNAHHF